MDMLKTMLEMQLAVDKAIEEATTWTFHEIGGEAPPMIRGSYSTVHDGMRILVVGFELHDKRLSYDGTAVCGFTVYHLKFEQAARAFEMAQKALAKGEANAGD